MEADTVSEQYFLDYCKARGYNAKRISPVQNAGRFPDYEATTPAGSVIVEIKELIPNDEDKAFTAKFEKEGKAQFENHFIGRRVRDAIRDAAAQLRSYKDTPLPEILLLYDNAASASYEGFNDYLDPMNVGAGMFGEPVIRFWLDPKLKPDGAPDATHGGRRELTEKNRVYIGAVAVMKLDSAGEICINFFHNPFSTKSVSPRYFLHPNDRHYVKSKHPDSAEWGWDEFVGDRENA
jgi:hypothetical protein